MVWCVGRSNQSARVQQICMKPHLILTLLFAADNCNDVGWILGYTSDTSAVIVDLGSPRAVGSIDLYSVYGGVRPAFC